MRMAGQAREEDKKKLTFAQSLTFALFDLFINRKFIY